MNPQQRLERIRQNEEKLTQLGLPSIPTRKTQYCIFRVPRVYTRRSSATKLPDRVCPHRRSKVLLSGVYADVPDTLKCGKRTKADSEGADSEGADSEGADSEGADSECESSDDNSKGRLALAKTTEYKRIIELAQNVIGLSIEDQRGRWWERLIIQTNSHTVIRQYGDEWIRINTREYRYPIEPKTLPTVVHMMRKRPDNIFVFRLPECTAPMQRILDKSEEYGQLRWRYTPNMLARTKSDPSKPQSVNNEKGNIIEGRGIGKFRRTIMLPLSNKTKANPAWTSINWVRQNPGKWLLVEKKNKTSLNSCPKELWCSIEVRLYPK